MSWGFMIVCCLPAESTAFSRACEGVFVNFDRRICHLKRQVPIYITQDFVYFLILFSLWQAKHHRSHFPILIKNCNPACLEGSLVSLLVIHHMSLEERQIVWCLSTETIMKPKCIPHRAWSSDLHLLLWKMRVKSVGMENTVVSSFPSNRPAPPVHMRWKGKLEKEAVLIQPCS